MCIPEAAETEAKVPLVDIMLCWKKNIVELSNPHLPILACAKNREAGILFGKDFSEK